MGRSLPIVMLISLAIAQFSCADARSEQNAGIPPLSIPGPAAGVLSPLPPVPRGQTTVIGGAIRNVDPVRDQFTLKVFGGGQMKILFDERTQVYRDGKRTPLHDLQPDPHASVETVLDGTKIFARSIRMLSRVPEGEFRGQVRSYNPGTRDLIVSAALSGGEPIELYVPSGTPFLRQGQEASSSASSGSAALVKGTLISVQFNSGNNKKGRGIASQITILATPGSVFVFRGNISFLDLHSKLLVLTDPRDGKSYKISFDPARFAASKNLREGTHITVKAKFDGTGYVANAITVN